MRPDGVRPALSGAHVTRRARAPLAYMTQRRRLDHFLLQKAAEAGAEVREGETADARELDARIVIGADGCNGSSAKQLGLAENVVHGVALEANYPYEARYAGAMVLEIAVIRGGYGWIFPKGDHINVGVGGNAEEGPRLRGELRRMCEAYGIDPESATETRGYRLPMRQPRTLLARGTTAVIGDAAGLVDPFSGDGMYEAFLSAKLVTNAALDVLAGRAENLDGNQAAVERRIAPLTRAGWGAKGAFERFPRTTYALARLPVTFRRSRSSCRGSCSRRARPAARSASRSARSMPSRELPGGLLLFPISCISLNMGRYIEMMMIPTMKPTPIIISGSMIEVRFAIAASTSSS